MNGTKINRDKTIVGDAPKKPQSISRRIAINLGRIFFLGLLCWGLFSLVWWVRESNGRTQMHKRLVALKSLGFPIYNESLKNRYRERTSADRTERWLAVFRKVKVAVHSAETDRLPGFPVPGEILWSRPIKRDNPTAATHQFRENISPLISEIRELASYNEPVYFPIEFRGMGTNMKSLIGDIDVATLMRFHGEHEVTNRDSVAICRDIKTLLEISKVNSSGPTSVSRLLTFGIKSQAVKLAQLALENGCLEKEELRQLSTMFPVEENFTKVWREIIEGDRSMMIYHFLNPASLMNSNRDKRSNRPMNARGIDCCYYLDWMSKAAAINSSSIDSFLTESDSFDKEFAAFSKGGTLRSFDTVLTRTLVPSARRIAIELTRSSIESQLATAAIAIRLYEHENQMLPSRIEAIDSHGLNWAIPEGHNLGFRFDQDEGIHLWGFLSQEYSQPSNSRQMNLGTDRQDYYVWQLKPLKTINPNALDKF